MIGSSSVAYAPRRVKCIQRCLRASAWRSRFSLSGPPRRGPRVGARRLLVSRSNVPQTKEIAAGAPGDDGPRPGMQVGVPFVGEMPDEARGCPRCEGLVVMVAA